jgi:hypothetical protein
MPNAAGRTLGWMIAPDGFAVPDSIEPVIGWRAWALAPTPDGRPELRPIIYAGERWPAGEPARAECPPHASSGHHAPEADCSCGLYAVDGLDRLPAVTGRDVTVIGSVSMWGTLIEHESGLRAELAYPDRLRLVCGMCWHASVFSPDVVGVSRTSRGTLLALCERHARGTDGSQPDPKMLERELLSAYAADPLPNEAVSAVAAAWSHPTRRARRSWARMSPASALMGVLFFGVFLALMALASTVR